MRPATDPGRIRLRRLRTDELTPVEIDSIQALMAVAFADTDEERFTDDDWQHAIGGTHVLLHVDGDLVAHASVVERAIHIADRPLRTGYVEAVATAPDRQGAGFGTIVMEEVGAIIGDGFELGMLGTGSHHFYERLGWRTWRGPSAVRTTEGLRPTPDDDGYLMVLETAAAPDLDLFAPISCEWRPGDVW